MQYHAFISFPVITVISLYTEINIFSIAKKWTKVQNLTADISGQKVLVRARLHTSRGTGDLVKYLFYVTVMLSGPETMAGHEQVKMTYQITFWAVMITSFLKKYSQSNFSFNTWFGQSRSKFGRTLSFGLPLFQVLSFRCDSTIVEQWNLEFYVVNVLFFRKAVFHHLEGSPVHCSSYLCC